jgi:hypothetical protein
MTAKGDVPHDDYRSGFIVGYQAVVGTVRAVPAVPAQTATIANYTPFLMGVRAGVKAAGGSLTR